MHQSTNADLFLDMDEDEQAEWIDTQLEEFEAREELDRIRKLENRKKLRRLQHEMEEEEKNASTPDKKKAGKFSESSSPATLRQLYCHAMFRIVCSRVMFHLSRRYRFHQFHRYQIPS